MLRFQFGDKKDGTIPIMKDHRLVTTEFLLELKRVLENANAQTPTYKTGVKSAWETVQGLLAADKTCEHYHVDVSRGRDGSLYQCVKCGTGPNVPTPV